MCFTSIHHKTIYYVNVDNICPNKSTCVADIVEIPRDRKHVCLSYVGREDKRLHECIYKAKL